MILTDSDNNKTIQITRGSRIEIKLLGNPTTGYRWGLPAIKSQGALPDTVLVVLNKYMPNRPMLVGSGGTHTFTIEFTASGNFDLRFPYKRGWESKSGKTFNVIFNVR